LGDRAHSNASPLSVVSDPGAVVEDSEAASRVNQHTGAMQNSMQNFRICHALIPP
jgi:hypothetical protein